MNAYHVVKLYNDLKKRHLNCEVIIKQLEKENTSLSIENFFLRGEVERLNKQVVPAVGSDSLAEKDLQEDG